SMIHTVFTPTVFAVSTRPTVLASYRASSSNRRLLSGGAWLQELTALARFNDPHGVYAYCFCRVD
ncbi:MAG: hypothetical protein AB8G17_21595, partial [Gammaproteobacteria bacterium]